MAVPQALLVCHQHVAMKIELLRKIAIRDPRIQRFEDQGFEDWGFED